MALFFARPPGRVRPVLSPDRRKRPSERPAEHACARCIRGRFDSRAQKKSAMPALGIAHKPAWSADE
ncbi:hypothetical protein EVG18_29010 [Burkholderia pyrrocinia]|nr:hypothetical protein EVG18_29010 [Burkholderia pyrrocinia]